jgi:outer membrane protein TolC
VVATSSAGPLEQTRLADCLVTAERNNPGLKAGYYKWQGALQKIPQAMSLQDPQLTYMEYLKRTMEPQEELGVTQMFPYPGKRALRGRVESAEAEATRKEFEKTRLELRSEVKDAFYEFYYIEQTVRVNRENLDLLKRLEHNAATRYSVGKGGSQDVIKAQVEVGKFENDLRSLEDSSTPVRSRLNAAMNKPTTTLLAPPQEVGIPQVTLDTETILALAFRFNPELQAIDARIQKNRNQVALAQKDYYPDFTLGINWMKGNESLEMPPADDYVVSVQMNLPVYRKRLDAAVREAEWGVREFQSMREDAKNKLSVDLQSELYKLRNAERRMRLLADVLIPKARQSLQIFETSFSAAEANFLDLLDTQRELLMFQENYYRSIADYAQALAKIEAIVGRSLVDEGAPSILRPMISNQPSPQDGPVEVDNSQQETGRQSESAAPEERAWPVEPPQQPPPITPENH